MSFTKLVEQAANIAAMNATPAECQHEKTEVRERQIRGGSVQQIRQCMRCGESVGTPVKQLGRAKPFDEELRSDYRTMQQTLRDDARRKESNAWWARYHDHINSDDWRQMREKVLRRDGYVCRGCLEAKATEVHHVSYANFGAEFAFELLALCRPCHKRYHADGDAET